MSKLIEPVEVAKVLKGQGLTRKELTSTRHDHMNDRVKCVLFRDDSRVMCLPSLTPLGLKQEYLLVIRDVEDADHMAADDFWRAVLDELDKLPDSFKLAPSLQGDENMEQYIDAIASDGLTYYVGTRDDLIETRSYQFDVAKAMDDIPKDMTFAEYMADDDWVGRVTSDEYDPYAYHRHIEEALRTKGSDEDTQPSSPEAQE